MNLHRVLVRDPATMTMTLLKNVALEKKNASDADHATTKTMRIVREIVVPGGTRRMKTTMIVPGIVGLDAMNAMTMTTMIAREIDAPAGTTITMMTAPRDATE
jgi:hypothetical protein